MGVIPVINENDTVSTAELDHPTDSPERERVFGDNDKLSALVMTHIDADLLLLLSDVDGLYTTDPRTDGAELLGEVCDITDEVLNFAQGKNRRGRGGMSTKLAAARIATEANGLAVIANGRLPHVIERVCAGELVGTLFLPGARSELFGPCHRGELQTCFSPACVVDLGAKNRRHPGRCQTYRAESIEPPGRERRRSGRRKQDAREW